MSEDLPRLVAVFTASEQFSGPSLYFHQRSSKLRRDLGSASRAIASDEFLELIYATLTAWGMHRMGRGNTKLRSFDEFTQTIRRQDAAIRQLQHLSLSQIAESAFKGVAAEVWRLLASLSVSVAEAKIVANSKTLHHILPDLIPPIDRNYTFKFFYNRKELSISEEHAFYEIFSRFHSVAVERTASLVALSGDGWNSSPMKVLDNAIVGYAIDALNVQPEPGC